MSQENTNPNLLHFRVFLYEAPDNKFQIAFDCKAEDDSSAVKKAEIAYPGCEIMSYLPFDDSPLTYVIYSANESACSNGAGFWNNDEGWVQFEQADHYTSDEKSAFTLPIATGGDAKWALWDDANASCGGKIEPRRETNEGSMLVSLDGGITYVSAKEGVRIIYRNVMIDGEDGRGEVHINATHEGLITDIWTTRDEPLDHNIGTDSVMIDDIVTRLVASND